MNKATQKLRIIYLGTPEFSVAGLNTLVKNGWDVVAVVTAPDKPSGRGQMIQSSPLKQAALSLNIPVLQPTNLKDAIFLEELKSYQANLQIVVAFRMLPEVVWNMPSMGTFNLHASLLPQYRGAAPINWAIINGEKITGVTTFFLKHEIDTGDIIMQESLAIEDSDDAGSMYEKLMKLGAELILKSVQLIASGTYQTQAQNTQSNSLKIAPKIFKETCEINWDKRAIEVHNFVRGLSPYPTAWTNIKGRKFKIYKTSVMENLEAKDDIVTDHKNYLYHKTTLGYLSIEELKPEGKKRMSIQEYFRGNTI